MDSFAQAGCQRVLDAFNARDMRELAASVNDAVAKRRATRGAVLGGVIAGLTAIIECARDAGVKFTGPDARLMERLRASEDIRHGLATGDTALATSRLQLLVDTVARIRQQPQLGVLTMARSEPAEQVMKVDIIGMPDRETDTTIQRDKAGNIIKSTQTERDS